MCLRFFVPQEFVLESLTSAHASLWIHSQAIIQQLLELFDLTQLWWGHPICLQQGTDAYFRMLRNHLHGHKFNQS